MPTPKNKVVKEVSPKSVFPDASAIAGTLTCNQGDFLVLDTSAHVLKAVTTGELGTNFLGIAAQTLSSGKPLSPIQGTDVDSSEGVPALAGPIYGVTAKVIANTGDAFVPGAPVYIKDSGTRLVTSTQPMGAKAIGVYQGANIASAAANQEIECLIGANYPTGNLSF